MNNAIEIRIAECEKELNAVFNFRYRIYVEEMNRKQHYADHDQKRIQDPLDVGAINFAAWRGDELLGVVRVNFPRDSDIGIYEDFYAMRSVGVDHPQCTSIVTRLMVAPALRNSRLGLDLSIACYRYGLVCGIKWNFIDCNEHLETFFSTLGYTAHVPRAVHVEYGLVTRLRLNLHNDAHLTSIRSPFAHVLKEFVATRSDALAPILSSE